MASLRSLFAPSQSSSIAERAGEVAGLVVAPLFAVTSALRHARTFHPRGDLFRANVVPSRFASEHDRALADRLAGSALVRLSDALAKSGARWPDVLGCAIRFGEDQDLLFATIKRPWTMPFAPLTTRVGDFLGNDYFAVSAFSTPENARVWFRLHPEHRASPSVVPPRATRAEVRRARVTALARHGDAVLSMTIADGPRGPWRPLARVVIQDAVADPPSLSFDPFRDGRGIRPRGFVQALRRGAYAASQRTRRADRSA